MDDFRAKLLAGGVGDSQSRQALAVLMFTYAERRDRVAKNPVRLVKKPSSGRARPCAVARGGALWRRRARRPAGLRRPASSGGARLEWRHVRERTVLFEQKNVDGEIVAGQKTGRPPRTTPLWSALREDLLAWRLHSGRRAGLVFPNHRGEPFSDTQWGNWSTRIWKPVRERLQVSEPPYGLRHSYTSLQIREGASIPELAEELGHSRT